MHPVTTASAAHPASGPRAPRTPPGPRISVCVCSRSACPPWPQRLLGLASTRQEWWLSLRPVPPVVTSFWWPRGNPPWLSRPLVCPSLQPSFYSCAHRMAFRRGRWQRWKQDVGPPREATRGDPGRGRRREPGPHGRRSRLLPWSPGSFVLPCRVEGAQSSRARSLPGAPALPTCGAGFATVSKSFRGKTRTLWWNAKVTPSKTDLNQPSKPRAARPRGPRREPAREGLGPAARVPVAPGGGACGVCVGHAGPAHLALHVSAAPWLGHTSTQRAP